MQSIGIIGATSLIGKRLVPLLREEGFTLHALTRKPVQAEQNGTGLTWHCIEWANAFPRCETWVALLPILSLPPYLAQLEQAGITRLIVFSSTSLLTKKDSEDPSERQLSLLLAEAEQTIETWALRNKVQFTVLRPTMVYDEGKDRNVSAMARFIRRFSVFPVTGQGKGKRMPVHARDLSMAVSKILQKPSLPQNYYNVSGGEIITYRQMVQRIFEGLGKRPVIIPLPQSLLVIALKLVSRLRGFGNFTPGIALRMQKDQTFSCEEAKRDFGYDPSAFHPRFI